MKLKRIVLELKTGLIRVYALYGLSPPMRVGGYRYLRLETIAYLLRALAPVVSTYTFTSPFGSGELGVNNKEIRDGKLGTLYYLFHICPTGSHTRNHAGTFCRKMVCKKMD